MKIAVWGVFAFVALLWTGTAALLAQFVQWSAQALAAGGGTSIGAIVATVSMPPWLGPWIDAATWAVAQEAVGSALASLPAALPVVGGALAWLVPAVWVTWGLGLVALVGLALLATSMLGRSGRGLGSGPQTA